MLATMNLFLMVCLCFVAVSCNGVEIEETMLQLMERVQALETKEAAQTAHAQKLEEKIQQLENRCPDSNPLQLVNDEDIASKNRLQRFIQESEYIAFHALLSAAAGTNNVVGQILVFEQTTINIGGAYNNSTGIFISPIDGLYIFSVALGGADSTDGHNHVDIMKNGAEVAAAYASGAGLFDQGSVTVVMHLDTGDEVHVSTQRHDAINVYGDKLTSFMGCLILPL